MNVAVCIATHERPILLAQLLRALDGQQFTALPAPAVTLIVADNDAKGSAEATCQANATRWPLVYRIEPRRGIAQARNCTLSQIGNADFIVFVDDDEIPEPGWLQELLLAQQRYAADVISGPVIPVLPSNSPQWFVDGRFFDSPDFVSGQRLDSCATNNTLVARAVLDRVGGFDEQFQLSGADDLHFFRRVYRAGFKMVWCCEAVVSESITSDRANLRWLLRRSFRAGNSAVLVEAALDHRPATQISRFFKACMRILQGAAGLLLATFRGRIQSVRSARRISLGAGMLAGLFHFTYQSHQVTTGE